MQTIVNVWQNIVMLLLSIVILLGLFVISLNNYLFFHCITEGFAIIVAVLVWVLAEKTYKYSQDEFMLFLGIALINIAIIDFLHVLTYKGMGVFQIDSANIATQFWIAARYIEAASFIVSIFFVKRSFSPNKAKFYYFMLTVIIIYFILFNNLFPDCFVEGEGLTPFKVVSEYIIMSILAVGLFYMCHNRQYFNVIVFKPLWLSVVLTIISELSFTLYNDVYGVMNFTGHVLKLLSFYCIYFGIIKAGLEEPYELIFKNLQRMSHLDPLTEAFNRRYFLEQLEAVLASSDSSFPSPAIIMLDIDNFKTINDRFGHSKGDEILVEMVKMIRSMLAKNACFARWGGEEFVILLKSAPMEKACTVAEEIRRQISSIYVADDYMLTASLGVANINVDDTSDYIMRKVDDLMYKAKRTGKNRVVSF